MSTTPRPDSPPSLIDIEVLDLGPLYEQAVRHYMSLDPSRAQWPVEKRSRLRIRTECRWGRVLLEDEALFLLNEKGEGPRQPLSLVIRAYVSLYAELLPQGDDKGFFETVPFCKVPVDRCSAASFRSLGLVGLEEFVRAKIPEMEEAYSLWLDLLRKAKTRARENTRSRVTLRT